MRLSVSDIDWSKLDERERYTLDHVIPRIEEGFEIREIAAELGLDANAVQADYERLAAKVMALSPSIELPPLSDEEYEALKQGIADYGQQMPILRGSPTSGLPGEIIDGRHRRKICAQLRIDPWIKDVDGSADQLHALGLVLNLGRRHMSTSSRRGIVKAKLLADPTLSDRTIAATVGVSPTTVGTVRRELEGAGAVSKLDTRLGSDGITQSIRERAPQPPPAHRSIRVLVAADLFEQYVGAWVSCRAFRLVERRPGVHELEVQILDPVAAAGEQIDELERHIAKLASEHSRSAYDVAREFLRTASEVFGRTIPELADLHNDEAEWLVARIGALLDGATA